MLADQPIAEAGAEFLNARIRKARKLVKVAAAGDADGVHDLRVAIRKIRAALSVLQETAVFAADDHDVLEKSEVKLARLFSALGDVRDQDVIAARVSSIAFGAPTLDSSLRSSIASAKKKSVVVLTREERKCVAKDLERRRRRAGKRLRTLMRKEDPVRVLRKIKRRITRRAHTTPHLIVRHCASSILVERFEAVRRYEVASDTQAPSPCFDVDDNVDIKTLHRLRIAIKSLRYAIDVFADGLGEHAATLDAILQRAQNQLGDLHDHRAAWKFVRKTLRRSRGKAALSKSTSELTLADEGSAEILSKFAATWRELVSANCTRLVLQVVEDLLDRSAEPTT